MGIVELLLVSVGLAMDAFAVSLCKGLRMRKINYGQAFLIALSFGFFQAAMPLLGWLLGMQFERYITAIDHWIAFILLSIIGSKMLYDSLTEDASCPVETVTRLDLRELLLLSIATSIDALAVGITFAFLKTDICIAVSMIGWLPSCSAWQPLPSQPFRKPTAEQSRNPRWVVLILIGLRSSFPLGIIPF